MLLIILVMLHPLKVLMVSDVYYPHPGGISEHVHHLTIELRKRGHEVKILTSGNKNKHFPFTDPDYVIRVGKSFKVPINKSLTNITFSPLITKRVKEILSNRYDIVHVHGSLAPTLPLLAVNYANTSIVVTFHAAHNDSVLYEIFKPILSRSFLKIHTPIAVSQVAKESVEKYFPGDYVIVPNGIDVDRFSPEVDSISSLREPGVFNLLFVGRLEPRKGIKDLLKALPYVFKILPNVKLIVVGGGPLMRWYTKKVEEELKGKVIFTGTAPPEMLPHYYRTADLFVSPATGGESFGIVLLEAMASGIPIVASDIPGYNNVVENGKEGLLVPPESPQLLASAIVTLLKRENLRKKMGEMGRLKATQNFAWPKITRKIEEIYFETLEKRGKNVTSLHN